MKKTLMLMAAFAAAALMSTAATASASPAHFDPGGIPAASASKSIQSSDSFYVVKAEPGAVQAVAVKDVNPVSIIQLACTSVKSGDEGMGGPVRVGAFGPCSGGDPNERPMARTPGGDGADGTFAASPGTSPVPAIHQRT